MTLFTASRKSFSEATCTGKTLPSGTELSFSLHFTSALRYQVLTLAIHMLCIAATIALHCRVYASISIVNPEWYNCLHHSTVFFTHHQEGSKKLSFFSYSMQERYIQLQPHWSSWLVADHFSATAAARNRYSLIQLKGTIADSGDSKPKEWTLHTID